MFCLLIWWTLYLGRLKLSLSIPFKDGCRARRDILMHSSEPSSSDTGAPFNDFDMGLSTTHLSGNLPRSKGASLIQKIELKPAEQQRIPLGSFKEGNPPKGFSVEITPDPNPAGSVLTEVTSLGTTKQYRLILHVTNYGAKTVNVEVWRL
jgi:hypothetical protein